MQRSPKDIVAGLIFVGFGLAFALGATTYPLGAIERMGPGFYPLLVGVVLVVLGAVVAIRPLGEPDEDRTVAPPWKALVLVLGSILLFGVTVRGLGLIPSIFVASSLSAFASERTSVPMAVVLGAALTTISFLVFVLALQLNLPLLGPWLPRL